MHSVRNAHSFLLGHNIRLFPDAMQSPLFIVKERLAGNKFGEICVCISPTQAKMYAIKPKIPETYYQPDALYTLQSKNVKCQQMLFFFVQVDHPV